MNPLPPQDSRVELSTGGTETEFMERTEAPQHSSGDARERPSWFRPLLSEAYRAFEAYDRKGPGIRYASLEDYFKAGAEWAALSRQVRPEGVDSDLIQRVRYRVGNPSAWDAYDEGASELFRECLAALGSQDRPEGALDRVEAILRETWEGKSIGDLGGTLYREVAERILALPGRPAPDALRKALADAVEVLEHVHPDGTDFDASVEFAIEQGKVALASRSAPDGWVLVPETPTDAMEDAGAQRAFDLVASDTSWNRRAKAVYAAMLAASPSAPQPARVWNNVTKTFDHPPSALSGEGVE